MVGKRIIDQLCQFGRKSSAIDKIVLFGSRAFGDYKEKSDIDLAFIAPKMSDKEWVELTFRLEEELDTLLSLDLIKYEEASKELKEEIMENGKILYSAESSYNKKLS